MNRLQRRSHVRRASHAIDAAKLDSLSDDSDFALAREYAGNALVIARAEFPPPAEGVDR